MKIIPYPIFVEIKYQNPFDIFRKFSCECGAVFFDSAQFMEGCGQYSFIALDPFYSMQCKNETFDPFNELKKQLQEYPLTFHADLPPFQGGAAGFFSYDVCHYLEKLPRAQDDMQFPDLILGFYDLVIAFDHLQNRAWIFSSGYPEKEKTKREKRARDRMAWLQDKLLTDSKEKAISKNKANAKANFTADEYEKAVRKVIEYIRAGDIFEANISQRFTADLPLDLSAFDLYERLRKLNPAPFSAFLNFGETILASASPERFLKLTSGVVETRPIKGTRPRGKNVEEDNKFAAELLQSEKDHAENIMIVDLLRNDLSKVCEDHSVEVMQLCGLESYATVHHLVSVVKGKLCEDKNAIDLLRATFPGGSITGAPKIRAMEIISEIEPTQRGPYCGCIGYIGFNGDLDTSITIRTYSIKNNKITFQAGGAVTLDSDPKQEYLETLTKAKALRLALEF